VREEEQRGGGTRETERESETERRRVREAFPLGACLNDTEPDRVVLCANASRHGFHNPAPPPVLPFMAAAPPKAVPARLVTASALLLAMGTRTFSIDLSVDDAVAKAQEMTALFKQQAQQQKSAAVLTNGPPCSDLPRDGSSEEKRSSSDERTPCAGDAAQYCLPSGQLRATGLFTKQGPQSVCCTFHAQAQAKPDREEFARWTLSSVSPVSRHSAVYHFTSTDGTRGTPYKRGRGRTIWHKTWHTTLRTTDGVERDYTPISTWEQWASGECDLLVGVRPLEAAASWLHAQPLGGDVWLSKPKTTLVVPSLVHPNQFTANHPEALAHDSILLVLGGAGAIPHVAQVLQHTDATTCFGKSGERVPPLQAPVHLIYTCERDDLLMASELARWCAAEDGTRARLRRLVLAVSAPQEQEGAAAFPQKAAEDGIAVEQLKPLENVRVVQDEARGEAPLTSELLRAEMAPLHALGRCRVVVSGPAAFNVAVAEMLEAQCGVDANAITIVEVAGDVVEVAGDNVESTSA
jgi:NAD(P)H-flavin reductase